MRTDGITSDRQEKRTCIRHYETTAGGLCTTPCPVFPEKKVGSAGCSLCPSYATRSIPGHYVRCYMVRI